MSARFDLITVGRSSIDLYSNQSGAAFVDIESFGAFVGGCPTNIAVGVSRLGMKTALLTAVGEDPVGDFVLAFLEREGVSTEYVPRIAGHNTSAVVLGIEPPDHFPLLFYREGCADVQLGIEHVEAAPINSARALLLTGTGLSRQPSMAATMRAAERARLSGARVFLDLDLRPDQWHESAAYGVLIRAILPLVDVAIGTEEEIKAAASAGGVSVADAQQSSPTVEGDLDRAIARLCEFSLQALVEKRGARGARLHLPGGETMESTPFSVPVVNVLGAGDAFASGFIFGYLSDWEWGRCLELGNACGALVVGRQGCANFMPTLQEAEALISGGGGS